MTRITRKPSTRRRHTRKYYVMRRRRHIFYTVVAAVVIVLSVWTFRKCSSRGGSYDPVPLEHTARTFPTCDTVRFDGRFQSTFNDVQEVQIEAAISGGIEPLADTSGIASLLEQGRLVPVVAGELYETDEVNLPYLVPDARDLLDEIARRYRQRSGDSTPLRITGCLRTDEHISRLMRRNVNSVKNSCHLYGTTIDISYRYLSLEQKRLLAQILYELQQAGHCYVKYERKQPCFHITVRQAE